MKVSNFPFEKMKYMIDHFHFQIVISDDEEGEIVDDEDLPLKIPQTTKDPRPQDPRLRKKGSLGELLASKRRSTKSSRHTEDPSKSARAARFKGSYRVPSPPRSPKSVSPNSMRSPKLFDSPQVILYIPIRSGFDRFSV